MRRSIFHVRPRDTGKGWVIDEYDGRGAWQSTYGLGSETEPWDKIKAQRQVFQLRRKSLNSEAVNNEGVVNKAVPVIPELVPDWERLEQDVVRSLRVLAVTAGEQTNAPPELRTGIWNDLIMPNVQLLTEFCTNVYIEEEGK